MKYKCLTHHIIPTLLFLAGKIIYCLSTNYLTCGKRHSKIISTLKACSALYKNYAEFFV